MQIGSKIIFLFVVEKLGAREMYGNFHKREIFDYFHSNALVKIMISPWGVDHHKHIRSKRYEVGRKREASVWRAKNCFYNLLIQK